MIAQAAAGKKIYNHVEVEAMSYYDSDRLDPLPATDARYPSGNWTSHLEQAHSSGNLSKLVSYSSTNNITLNRKFNKGYLASFWGHTRILKRVVESGEASALILEDDIDFEWDVERLWARIELNLPNDWDIVYLGHCWGQEQLSLSPRTHHKVPHS